MNKIEFQEKLEEGVRLIEKGEYEKAVDAFDLLNLDSVKDVRILQNIAKAYEKCYRYEDAEELLIQARGAAPRSRGVLFHLCTLAIKAGNLGGAIVYYNEFCEVAKNDSERFVLQYRIARAENKSDKELISILENFKGEEPDDRWMYELAKLYATNDRTAEALELCDEICLWFYNGKYVNLAKELRAYLTGEPIKEDPRYIDLSDQEADTAEPVNFHTEPVEKEEASEIAEQKTPEIIEQTPEDMPEEAEAEAVIDVASWESDGENEDLLVEENEDDVLVEENGSEGLPEDEDREDIRLIIEEVPELPEGAQASKEDLYRVVPDAKEAALETAGGEEKNRETSVEDEAAEDVNAGFPEIKKEAEIEQEGFQEIGTVLKEAPETLKETEEGLSIFEAKEEEAPDEFDIEELNRFINAHLVETPMAAVPETAEDTTEKAIQAETTTSEEKKEQETEVKLNEETVPEEQVLSEADETYPESETAPEEDESLPEEDISPEAGEETLLKAEREILQETETENEPEVIVETEKKLTEDAPEFLEEDKPGGPEGILSFDGIPLNPEEENGIWHFMAFGEEEREVLELAKTKLKEIVRRSGDLGGFKMTKLNASKLEHVDIRAVFNQFKGKMVILEEVSRLSDEQLLEFGKLLQSSDRELLICFSDTEGNLASVLARAPGLKHSFTAAFSVLMPEPSDLFEVMRAYLEKEDAVFTEEGKQEAKTYIENVLNKQKGDLNRAAEEIAGKALYAAEHSGLFGLFSGHVDEEGILRVTEKDFRKAVK